MLKNITDEQEPDLTSSNHCIYASTVISTELCNIKIKAPKKNVPKKLALQECIQKQINTLRSDLETLKYVKNNLKQFYRNNGKSQIKINKALSERRYAFFLGKNMVLQQNLGL